MAAHVGIALSSHAQAFTPAADAVAQAKEIGALTRWLAISKGMLKAVQVGLLLSLLYNVLGVGLAAMGLLLPWFAAAFMPLSSLSVVALSVLLTRWWAKPHLSAR
jgi:Cu+-exporting ATPase